MSALPGATRAGFGFAGPITQLSPLSYYGHAIGLHNTGRFRPLDVAARGEESSAEQVGVSTAFQRRTCKVCAPLRVTRLERDGSPHVRKIVRAQGRVPALAAGRRASSP